MAQVFTPCAGGVAKYPVPAGDGECPPWVAIKVDDFTLDVVPITGFALELNTNHQFVHSLNELIYVFSFGDRVGELTLSGISFVGECSDANAGKVITLFAHYLDKRLAQNLKPAKITVGDTTSAQLLGFLTGMRLDMPNPELPIVQWILRYAVIVDASVGAGGSGPRGLPGADDVDAADFTEVV
jgi:hypothetical protein